MSADEAAVVARLIGQIVLPNMRRRGDPDRHVVLRAARLLLELNPGASMVDPETCPECREPIQQPATGRRRKWCSDRCKSRARRR